MPIDLETCSPSTTRTLFADVSETQRETLRIAQDPSTAAEVLLALVSDELLVARAVARNISITPAVATALLQASFSNFLQGRLNQSSGYGRCLLKHYCGTRSVSMCSRQRASPALRP